MAYEIGSNCELCLEILLPSGKDPTSIYAKHLVNCLKMGFLGRIGDVAFPE